MILPGQAQQKSSPAPSVPPAATTSKITLDTSETLFSLLAAMNACGYDADLANSDPLRAQIRQEIAQKAAASEEAAHARTEFCNFYKDHQNTDPARDLAQFVSLGLFLTPPPTFQPSVQEADLPHLAQVALQSRAVQSNPSPITDAAQIEAVLRAAW